jgi:hypothetical protein
MLSPITSCSREHRYKALADLVHTVSSLFALNFNATRLVGSDPCIKASSSLSFVFCQGLPVGADKRLFFLFLGVIGGDIILGGV